MSFIFFGDPEDATVSTSAGWLATRPAPYVPRAVLAGAIDFAIGMPEDATVNTSAGWVATRPAPLVPSAVLAGAIVFAIGVLSPPGEIYRVPVEEYYQWQRPVTAFLAIPPGSPAKGDRYIVDAGATGAWSARADQLAWFDGTVWQFDVP